MNALDINSAVPYQYVAAINGVAANGQLSVQLQLNNDSWFGLYSIRVITSADQPGDAQPNNASIRIRMNNSQRQWSNDFVPQAALSPRNVVMPQFNILLPPGMQFTIEAMNHTASTLNVQVILCGVAYFNRP